MSKIMNEQINEKQDEIIKEFSKLNDWLDKYEYIINLGKNLEILDEDLKTDENLISGCQSQVWFKTEIKNGRVQILADSDSLIVKGLISLLIRVFNNQNPNDIANSELYFIEKIGLNKNLSPSRVNGLMSIINHIKSETKSVTN